jgi:hypothetical protein
MRINRLEPGTYFLWVDAYATSTISYDGPFQLALTASDPLPPPANNTCPAAEALELPAGLVVIAAMHGASEESDHRVIADRREEGSFLNGLEHLDLLRGRQTGEFAGARE